MLRSHLQDNPAEDIAAAGRLVRGGGIREREAMEHGRGLEPVLLHLAR